MTDRICLIHAGTHKTGTTSLQFFLQENAAALRAAGVHFVQAGRWNNLPGSHEVAWELLGDCRKRLAELIEELRASASRTAVVSSEDFSLLWTRPQGLVELSERLTAVGYIPKVLFYLRAQGPYAESMYVERIKQGQIVPVDEYLGKILQTGRYTPENTQQHIQFQYTRLIEPFARAFGRENVIVRVYAPKDRSEIFRDFLGVMNRCDETFAKTPYKLNVSRPRENPSSSFAELLETVHEKLGLDGSAVIPEIPAGQAAARFALFSRDEHLALLERFAADNREVAAAYGTELPFTTQADLPPPDDPVWENVRLQRPLFDRCLLHWTGISRSQV